MNVAKNTTAFLCFTVLLWAWTGAPWPHDLPLDAVVLYAGSGLAGLTICDTFFLRAVLELGPRRATLLMTLAPVIVFGATLTPLFGQTHVLDRPWPWVGLACALAGVALAASEGRDAHPDPARARRGLIDGLLATVFQAGGVLLARLGYERGREVADPSGLYVPVAGADVRMIAGVAGLVVVGAAGRLFRHWGQTLSHRSTLVPLVVAAFFGTFLGIGLNQAGIAWADSTGAATTINSLSPVWLVPLSAAFLGERHTLRAWLSTLLAIAGVALLAS
jgi:drug/metabolite transporter (DMT)-like permease